jgi:non-specific serine/threonine protein kinase/serine/threonine-protein kinase
VRRNRAAVAAGLLVFLSLTGGLIATTWEAHVARQQRARAERRFDDVRHLAESFLFEFHDKIKNLPGSRPAQQLIVQRALEYLRSLEQEVRGNASLECELADAYLKVGDVQGNQYVSNLGDTAGAVASYWQALAISEEVLRSDPKNVDALRYNSRAHRSIGEVLPLQGDATGALPHFRQAISAMERVTQAVPQDVEARFELSTCYEMMGDVLGHSGLANLSDPNAARAAYEKALAIDQESLERDPSSVRARRGTAMMRMKVGDMELDPSKALADYQASEVVLEALSNADPVNGPLRRSLAMLERKIGNSYESLNQIQAALEQYRKGSAIGRQLLLADEKNAQARLDYSVGLKTRADLLYKTGDHRGALELYRETLAWLQPLYQAEPNNPLLQGRYSEMLVNVGEVLAELHRENEARPLFLRGLAITKEMADHPGATADSVMQYAEDLMDCPLEDLRSPDTALKYARRAVTMMGQPGPDSLEQLARAFFQANDPGSAIEFERKAMAMMPEASRKNSAERLARYQSKLQQLASPAHR